VKCAPEIEEENVLGKYSAKNARSVGREPHIMPMLSSIADQVAVPGLSQVIS
jgi:hypothetical protein